MAPRVFTMEQLREFLAAARGERSCVLIHFLAWTGVRLGEALALLWDDVDLDGKTAFIRRSFRVEKHRPVFGRRTIDLPGALVQMLQGLDPPSDLVFQDEARAFVRSRRVRRVFRRVFRRISRHAGVPFGNAYLLRHTWATQMLARGAPANYVSRALGHDST
jgi:integrase